MSSPINRPHLLSPEEEDRNSDDLSPEELTEARREYLRLKRLRKAAKGFGIFTAIDLRYHRSEAPTLAARQGGGVTCRIFGILRFLFLESGEYQG